MERPDRHLAPTQMLADMPPMRDHITKPLDAVTYCYLGDGRNNTADSLLVTGAMLGMDTRICAQAHLQPAAEVRQIAKARAAESGARLTITADVATGVAGADCRSSHDDSRAAPVHLRDP